MKRCLCLLAWLAAIPIAAAETTYRCEQGGRTVYQQSPCQGGREVRADDGRSDAQRREAAQAARADATLSKQLQHEREQAEKSAATAGPVRIGAAPRPPVDVPAKAKTKGKKKRDQHAKQAGKDEDFRAVGPAPAHKSKSSR